LGELGEIRPSGPRIKRERLARVADAKLGVGYFATVEQAREWLAR
jgi:hypothetical protein